MMERVTLVGGQVIMAHAEGSCFTPDNCSIHNPSNHHMRYMAQSFRPDLHLMERVCDHGVGHPDPDQIAYWTKSLSVLERHTAAIHGCDGCCHRDRVIRPTAYSGE